MLCQKVASEGKHGNFTPHFSVKTNEISLVSIKFDSFSDIANIFNNKKFTLCIHNFFVDNLGNSDILAFGIFSNIFR